MWDTRPVTLHPSRAGHARTKGPPDPQPGILQHNPSSSTEPNPHPWGRLQPPHAAPNIQSASKTPSSHLFLVPAPALKPSGLFLSQAIQAGGKKKKNKIPSGRRARGHYRLKQHDPLWWPKVIPAAAEAAGKMVTGSRRRRRHERGKTGWEVKGKARTWRIFGEGGCLPTPIPVGCPPSWLGAPLSWERGDARTEPVAFGVTQPGLAVLSCG